MIPVSVVIPCYRCSKSIERALVSISTQSAPPKEVIFIDDASGDDTLEILYRLAHKNPGWIKVIESKKNRGPGGSRNIGWDAATQPYIAFLDADDSWHPEKIYVQYKYMLENLDVIISGHQFVASDGCPETPPDIPSTIAVTEIKKLSLIFKNCFNTPTVMLKRDIPFRFDERRRFCEDVYLWQQIAFGGLKIMRIESPLAYVHKAIYGESGLSAQLSKMEKGELSNFIALYRARKINCLFCILAIVFSIAKFGKRLVVSWVTQNVLTELRKNRIIG